MRLCKFFFRQFKCNIYFLGGKKAAGFHDIGNSAYIGMFYLLAIKKIIHKSVLRQTVTKHEISSSNQTKTGPKEIKFQGLFHVHNGKTGENNHGNNFLNDLELP